MNNGYTLLGISVIVGILSIAWASREHGIVIFSPRSITSRSGDGYHIDKAKIEDYIRMLLILAAVSVIVGMIISQNIGMVLEFTAINLFFLSYGIAWDGLLIKTPAKKDEIAGKQ